MRQIIFISITLLVITSCGKRDDFQYQMAGVYDITNIKQEIIKNGEIISTTEEATEGLLLLRQGSVSVDSRWELEISTSMTIKAWDELSGPISKRYWDASQDDHRLSLVVENSFASRKALTFTVTKRKKRSLELVYVDLEIDGNQEITETIETFSLKLRD